MTLNTFSSGVNTDFSTELNENFIVNSLFEIDTTTDLDVTDTSGSGTSSTPKEYTAISDVGSADTLEVEVNGFVAGTSIQVGDVTTYSIQIEVKEIGGSYGDIYNNTFALESGYIKSYATTHKYYHTLTAGQKTNGIQVRITTTADSGVAQTAVYTNRAVVLRGIGSA